MFSNQSFDVVGFESCWNTERPTETSEAQTEPCSFKEKESQAVTSQSVEVQTEPVDASSAVDYDKLAIFLKRVCPSVLSELDKIERSRSVNPAENVDQSYQGKKMLLTLQPSREIDEIKKMKVSSLSWNCGGSLLAFGFSCLKHENWCDHNSQVVFYNNMNREPSSNTPTKAFETSACVTQVSFHPFAPAIIAVGMVSGEVLVWNLQKDDDILLGSSASIPGGHRDAVTQLSWVRNLDPTQKSVPLVSSGRDGQVLIWHVGVHPGIFRLQEGFAISLDHGAHGRKVQTPMGGNVDNELGITCFSFAPQERSMFIAGVEGGGLLKCSLMTNKPASVNSAIPLKDPVLSSYEGHMGSVTDVQCSTTDDQTFLSSGIDNEIHVYHFDKPSPVKVIFADTVYVGLAWCPTNARLFVAWGENGTVDFYSSIKGEEIPSLRLEVDVKQAIATVHFNPQSNRLLAVGDVEGKVTVWQLPLLQSHSDLELLPTN